MVDFLLQPGWNLWLGLYNAEGEWPWTYSFLLVLQLIFAVHRYGRNLGLDALIVARLKGRHTLGGIFLAEARSHLTELRVVGVSEALKGVANHRAASE